MEQLTDIWLPMLCAFLSGGLAGGIGVFVAYDKYATKIFEANMQEVTKLITENAAREEKLLRYIDNLESGMQIRKNNSLHSGD